MAAGPIAVEEFDGGAIADLDGGDGADVPNPQGDVEQGDAEEQQPDELVCEPCEP